DRRGRCGRRRLPRRPTLRARPPHPRLRTAVVEVRRSQGAGHPRAVRHVGDAVLPASEHPDRPPRGAGVRPDARQAPAPDAVAAAAQPRGPPSRHPALTRAPGPHHPAGDGPGSAAATAPPRPRRPHPDRDGPTPTATAPPPPDPPPPRAPGPHPPPGVGPAPAAATAPPRPRRPHPDRDGPTPTATAPPRPDRPRTPAATAPPRPRSSGGGLAPPGSGDRQGERVH